VETDSHPDSIYYGEITGPNKIFGTSYNKSQTVEKYDTNAGDEPVRYNRAIELHTVGAGTKAVSKWEIGSVSVEKKSGSATLV
jgi:hypothetical protein